MSRDLNQTSTPQLSSNEQSDPTQAVIRGVTRYPDYINPPRLTSRIFVLHSVPALHSKIATFQLPTMSLFESYHMMGDPAGFHHYISQPSDDVVHVRMLNHSSTCSRTPPSPTNTSIFFSDFTYSPYPIDPLVESFFSFNDESPSSYELLMSFTFPEVTLKEFEEESDGEISHPWLHLTSSLTSSWSSMETLYDTTPSEIEQENHLEHLRNTRHPGRLYHVMNSGGSVLTPRPCPQIYSSGTEKTDGKKNFVTRIRSLVRKLKK